jgi:hypothetical protein
MRILTALGVGALAALCVLRRHDLATAAGARPPQAAEPAPFATPFRSRPEGCAT